MSESTSPPPEKLSYFFSMDAWDFIFLSLNFNSIAYGPDLSPSKHALESENEVLSSIGKAAQEEKWEENVVYILQNITINSLIQRNVYGD